MYGYEAKENSCEGCLAPDQKTKPRIVVVAGWGAKNARHHWPGGYGIVIKCPFI
jgi:hypothetical protein